MSVDAPLTYGQLFSWREIERYPEDWSQEANLPALWDLRGLSTATVTRALRQLVDRHEALRTTYHLRDGRPVQRVHATVEPPVEVVDRVVSDAAEAEATKGDLLRLPFSMTDDLNWRGLLVCSDGAPAYLALSFSHLIVDVWSIQHLGAQFRALVADEDATAMMGPTARELAERQRGQEWAGRLESAERYWREVLAGGLMDRLPTLPARVKRNRIEATLRSRRLGGLVAQAARQHGVTPPALVMALVAAGVARQLDTGAVTMSMMASNRFAPEHQRVVGTMNQLVPAVIPVDRAATLAEHVRRAHWASARAYRHASYDVDRIAAVAAEYPPGPAHDCWVNHLFRCWFNYIQLDRNPSDPADESPAELVWTPLAQQYGQAFRVRVEVQRGRTTLLMLSDPEVIPADGMTDILRTVALGAELAATDPGSGLKELWSGRSEDLAPSLFPPL